MKNENENEKTCKGLFYRCYIGQFLTKDGSFHERIKMVPLKRKSCKGCEQCSGLLEILQENSSQFGQGVILPSNLENGGLYYLAITNETHDWETGIVDSYSVEFIKSKE